MDMLHFTHAYFPTELFDSTLIIKNYAFGKKGSAYCALIGKNDFNLKAQKTNDLIQDGRKVFWIIEAGSKRDDGSFESFYNRILKNEINFNEESLELEYRSKQNKHFLKFDGDFILNGNKVDTEYDRFDSPYIQAKRKEKTMKFNFNDKYLYLDFNNQIREFN